MNEYLHASLLPTEPQMSELTVSEKDAAGFTPLSASLEAEIDQLGSLGEAYVESKKFVAEYEGRLKMLREGMEQHAKGNEALRGRGAMFAADLTEPAKTRVVKDISKIVQILGAGVFLKYAKFNVTDVDSLIDPEKRQEIIGFKDGNRKLIISKV